MAVETNSNVNAPDWELVKENYQPLKAGRRPGGLKDNTSELRKQLVEEQRRAFWEEIAGYKGDDPLEVWLRFIKWTQDTFQAGGHKAELLPLLERCTRELQLQPQYKNDIRYLRVWVQYADCLPDPGDVFLFLKENDIGLEHALYYIAYATYLEFRSSFAKADSVYQQGINRLANPVDRLKAKFQEFQHRMARRIQRKAQEQQTGCGEPDHPGRQTLGTIAARRPARGGLPGPAGLKRKAGCTPPKAAAQENGQGGLSIFMDDEFQAGAPAQSAPAALFAPGRSAAGPWSKLGSFEQSRKENTQRPSVWAGQKIKQQPAHSAPPAPVLEILVDPEFEDVEVGGMVSQDKAEPSLRQRLEKSCKGNHLGEALASDPLRLHRAQQSVPSAVQQVLKPAALQPKPTDCPDVKRRKEEVMVFDEAELAADGEELSFEELRARTWQARSAQQCGVPQLASTCYAQPSAPAAEPQLAKGMDTNQKQPSPAQEVLPVPPTAPPAEAEATAGNLRQAPAPRARTTHMAAPTMTISTRNAFAAINNMFQGSLPAEHSALPPNPYAEPTMTLATRNAFASINNMFKGSLPNEHSALPPRAGPFEPTVTINTKVAFEAINNMFGGGKPTESRGVPAGGSPFLAKDDTQYFCVLEPRHSSSFAVLEEQQQFMRPQAPQPAGGSFSIREDTQFIAPSEVQPAGDGFSIREDTQFIAPSAAQPAGGFSIREDTQFTAPPAAQPAIGFSIREDTQFIALPAAQPADGFSIREDTQFMGPSAAQPASGFNIREDTKFLGPFATQPEPAFSIPEDTQFLSVPSAACKKPGLHIHADKVPVAEAVTAAQVSKWGFAPGNEDTLQLELGGTLQLDCLAPLEQPVPSGSGLTVQMQDLRITEAEDKENANVDRAMLRDIHSVQHAAAALQPLSATYLAEPDLGADAVFQQQGMGPQDSFEVTAGEPSGAHPVVAEPFNPRFQTAMLASLEPPVLQWPGVSGCTAAEEAEISAALKGIKKAGGAVQLQLGGQVFEASCFVGAGAYATVFQASSSDGSAVALKMESPACPWEWYICQALHARLPDQLHQNFIDPLSLVLGPSASVLIAPFGASGSLQGLINAYLAKGQRPEEVVAMHFAIEILRLLDGLHAAHIVHSDIKPDNLLLQVQAAAGCDENASPLVQLQLIDFGRSIDLDLLPPGSLLQGDSGTDSFRCVEMREGNPWLYQADSYGACGVVHCLLFGEYMEVDRVMDAAGNVSLRLRQGWKRYWAQDVWNAFFSTLLNHTSSAAPPPIRQLLQQFEDHLAQNPTAARKLQSELRKVAAICRN